MTIGTIEVFRTETLSRDSKSKITRGRRRSRESGWQSRCIRVICLVLLELETLRESGGGGAEGSHGGEIVGGVSGREGGPRRHQAPEGYQLYIH